MVTALAVQDSNIWNRAPANQGARLPGNLASDGQSQGFEVKTGAFSGR